MIKDIDIKQKFVKFDFVRFNIIWTQSRAHLG